MLQSPTGGGGGVTLNQENIDSKSYQYILMNNLLKRNQWYEEMIRTKYRWEKTAPNMQQVIHADLERMKTNKVYERKLNQDLNGPKGLNWQCKQELQRLRSDERGVERELLRLNRDLGKSSILPSISRSPSIPQTSRLSIITEENFSTPIFDKPKIILRHSSNINSHRNLVPIKKQPSMSKPRSLPKPSIQRLIAKTSDDRQQHADIIEQQKRLVELRLKQFLH